MSNSTATLDPRRREKRAMLRWTAFILAFLLLQVALCFVGVTAALHNAPPVVTDYYDKAVHWDQSHKSAQP